MIRRGGTSLLLCFMRDGAKNIAKRGTWFDKKSIIAQNYQDELDRLRFNLDHLIFVKHFFKIKYF